MRIQFFKKQNSLKKGNHGPDLYFYWQVAVCFACAITLFSFYFGFRLFMDINQESNLSITDSKQVPVISKDRIEKTLEVFSEREIKSREILNSPSPIVDPSL